MFNIDLYSNRPLVIADMPPRRFASPKQDYAVQNTQMAMLKNNDFFKFDVIR